MCNPKGGDWDQPNDVKTNKLMPKTRKSYGSTKTSMIKHIHTKQTESINSTSKSRLDTDELTIGAKTGDQQLID